MEEYMKNYDHFSKKIVYKFILGYGGIGDCIKYFIHALNLCMKYKIRLSYLISNIPLEKYLRLKYDKMYVSAEHIKTKEIAAHDIPTLINDDEIYHLVHPLIFFNEFSYVTIHSIQEVFVFSEEVKLNRTQLLLPHYTNYLSLHLRLGDKFLETDVAYIQSKNDVRSYNEPDVLNFIEENADKIILFFCDNQNYKLKIKNKYKHIIITEGEIGHTGLYNTTDKQVLDTVTEFYIMTESEKIINAANSGFPLVAAKFKNIPLISL